MKLQFSAGGIKQNSFPFHLMFNSTPKNKHDCISQMLPINDRDLMPHEMWVSVLYRWRLLPRGEEAKIYDSSMLSVCCWKWSINNNLHIRWWSGNDFPFPLKGKRGGKKMCHQQKYLWFSFRLTFIIETGGKAKVSLMSCVNCFVSL